MPAQFPTHPDRTSGTADFYDKEQIDLHVTSNPEITSSADYYRKRELAQLANEAMEAADKGLTSYAEQGIKHMEAYLEAAARSGQVLTWARKEEVK